MDIEPMGVYLLGAFRVEWKGKPIRLPTRKIENLLAYLILHPGAQPREKLATLFWGDSTHEAARGSLRKALTLLRRHIDEQLLLTDRESVQINPSFPLQVDVLAFEEQALGLMKEASMAAQPFDSDLYPGDLLPEYYDDWILPMREHHHALYIDVMLRSVELLRAGSKYGQAIEYAQKILEMETANERAHQHLMFCYVTTGERNRALQQYEACERALREDLNVEPARETQGLYQWIKVAVTSIPSRAAKITNLPIPLSSFVGRGRELSEIKRLLLTQRLVTLTGAGGSGKTRLAIHAATDLIDSYRDGVWWVELAPLTDASLVAHAVARALGMDISSEQRVIEVIARYLQNRQALLVMDNCEHLIEASVQVADALLRECEGVRILATSREALGVMGEQVWVAPTLSVPTDGEINLVDLVMEYEAVQLFVERARAVRSDYAISESDALVVAEICRRLDGIPLAIELAAARMKMMSAGQIAERLGDRFGLLSRGARTAERRHQTLRAAVDWSYELLSEGERLLFNRLSIFAGGWTLESAEDICSGDGIEAGRILDLLGQLVDKSLVGVDGNGERYTMLETMKAYGMEKLAVTGEEEWMLERHLEHFLGLAETADEKIRSSEQLAWLERIRVERDNLNRAMEWSLSHPATLEKGVQLVCALAWYWSMVGDFMVARYWFEKALEESESLGRTATRAKILLWAGFTSGCTSLVWKKNMSDAQPLLEQSLEIWNSLGPDFIHEKAQCFLALGYFRKTFLNDEGGYGLIKESIEIFRARKETWWHALGLQILVYCMLSSAYSPDEIRGVIAEMAVLWKKTGDEYEWASVLAELGELADINGDFDEAIERYEESISIYEKLGSKGDVFQVLMNLATSKFIQQKGEQADLYYQEIIANAEKMGREIPYKINFGIGLLALQQGDILRAEEYLRYSIRECQATGIKHWLVLCIGGYAALAVVQNEPNAAARRFGAYKAQFDSIWKEQSQNLFLSRPHWRDEIEHYLVLCREQIQKDAFKQAWNEGCKLSLDEAIREILEESG